MSLAENDSNGQTIQTFVFMDFETTGLIEARNRPRITEMCFLAVNRLDMLENKLFPRVVNKLTLCLNPEKPVSLVASQITGLYNDNLEHQRSFSKDTVNLLNSFFDHLSKPVCLLAHNGNGFDFLVLSSELKRINQSLDSSLLCADTLEAFRSLDGLSPRYQPLVNQNERTPPNISTVPKAPPPLKRKSLSDVTAINRPEKIGKLDLGEQFTTDTDKVKKQLVFEDDEIDSNNSNSNVYKTNESSDTEKPNSHCEADDDKKDETESVQEMSESSEPHFTGSIEDCLYFEALDEAERVFFQNKDAPKPCDSGINSQKQSEDCDSGVTPSGVGQTTNSNVCSIESDTCLERSPTAATTESSESPFSSPVPITINSASGSSSVYSDATIMSAESSVSPTNSPVVGLKSSSKCSGVQMDMSPVATTLQAVASQEKTTLLATTSSSSSLETTPSTTSSLATKSSSSSLATTSSSSLATTSSSSLAAISSSSSLETTPSTASLLATSSSSLATTSSSSSLATTSSLSLATTSSATVGMTPVKRNSYKLEEIYFRLYGKPPPRSHLAEDDCVTLVYAVKKTPGFMDWVDQHAVLLTSIEPPY